MVIRHTVTSSGFK